MANQRLKDFWINKITTLIGNYQLLPNLLDEGDNWADKLQDLQKFVEIGNYARAVCRDVYIKAGKNVPQSFTTTAENYSNLLGDSYKDLENEYIELVNVIKTRIGVDPTDATLATDNDGNNIVDNGNPVPKWKQIIKQKLPNNYTKLTDIPAGYDLADILYARDLYLEIVDNATGLNDIIERNLTGGDVVVEYGFDFLHKVNKTRLQEYKDAAKTITDAENYLRLGGKSLVDVMNAGSPGEPLLNLPPTPAHADYLELPDSLANLVHWYKENDKLFNARATGIDLFDRNAVGNAIGLNLDKIENYAKSLNRLGLTDFQAATITSKLGTSKLSDIPAGKTLTDLITAAPTCSLAHCPPAHANYNTLKGESDHYHRIHTKLNGKVSDSDLDTFINHTCPDCQLAKHNDYDAIKTERDQLKTDQTTQEQAKQQAIQAKETQIITKIITDLGLTTERERENLLEAVITEIKTKITPPTDNSADKQKITELETKLATLQSPKSLTDLPISQEVKAEVIKISQELGLTAQSCAKLENATSYQELSNLQKKAFQEKLNSEIDSRKSANYLNWGLGALSIGSLLILAWILIKKTTFVPEIGDKKDK